MFSVYIETIYTKWKLQKITYVSPVLKLKGSDPDSNEKFFLHSNDDVAGFNLETLGQWYFSIISIVLGTVRLK